MRKTLGGILSAMVLILASAASSLAVTDSAACVGQFSRFFAHGGGETGVHRSDLAQFFAHNERPAGANVYRHVAQVHASLEECFAQFE